MALTISIITRGKWLLPASDLHLKLWKERYSENLQVNSSRLHKLSLLWSRVTSEQHLQIWQVISVQEACYDVGDLNVRRGYTC